MEKGEMLWREEMMAKMRKLYAAELQGHFEVEEEVLFPVMERCLGRLELVGELRKEHGSLAGLIARLDLTPGISSLDEFARLLEGHVRKEERQLFVEFEKRMPAEEAREVGREIESRLTKAWPKL